MKYSLIAARGNGKTYSTLKMVERLATGRCICCGKPAEEGQEICTMCEKIVDKFIELGNPGPILTADELRKILEPSQTQPKPLYED